MAQTIILISYKDTSVGSFGLGIAVAAAGRGVFGAGCGVGVGWRTAGEGGG